MVAGQVRGVAVVVVSLVLSALVTTVALWKVESGGDRTTRATRWVSTPSEPAKDDLCAKGTVVTEDGTPVAGMNVRLTLGEQKFTTLTARDGSFQIPHLDAGRYSLLAW